MAGEVTPFLFQGPAGRIEALWKAPEGISRGSAVVAHAHPLHGGQMHFKVVFRMARALARVGFGVLRFNFRGVGASDGAFDAGLGERDDFRAALDEAERRGGTPMVAAGFSFGSTVALSVGAEDPRVARLIGAGVPIDRWKFTGLSRVEKPALLISGGSDAFGDEKEFRRLAPDTFADGTVVVLEGADHFFANFLDQFEEEIFRFMSFVEAVP